MCYKSFLVVAQLATEGFKFAAMFIELMERK